MLALADARGTAHLEIAGLVHDAGHKHLSQQPQQPGTADAPGFLALATDDAVVRLQRVVVDPDFLDGAHGGAHAVFDAPALERRACGTGARDEPVGIAQHGLAVGAYVDEERQLGCFIHARAQHARADVRAHVARHAGQTVHHCLRVRGQP